MTLKIVWRNPEPPPTADWRVEQVVADEYGALYAVRRAGRTAAFELIPGSPVEDWGKGAAAGNTPLGGRVGRLLLLPLTWKELMARVRGALSDSGASHESKTVRFGRVRVDLLAMEVMRAERPVTLTAMEFKVLKFFVLSPKRVVSRDELLNEVWGYDNYPNTRTVDNHVLKLRQKLESDPGKPVHFRTVHGIGYKFIP